MPLSLEEQLAHLQERYPLARLKPIPNALGQLLRVPGVELPDGFQPRRIIGRRWNDYTRSWGPDITCWTGSQQFTMLVLLRPYQQPIRFWTLEKIELQTSGYSIAPKMAHMGEIPGTKVLAQQHCWVFRDWRPSVTLRGVVIANLQRFKILE